MYQTIGIIILANVVNRLSYVTRITNAALLQVGRELEESAQVCGARRLGTMWWVVAPLVRSSLVFGGLWTGLLVFREVSMPLMLAGPKTQVLSVRVWQTWDQGHFSEASALGVLMVLVMGVIATLAQRQWGLEVRRGLALNECRSDFYLSERLYHASSCHCVANDSAGKFFAGDPSPSSPHRRN